MPWSRKSIAIRPVESLSAYTRVHFTLFYVRQSSGSHYIMNIVYQRFTQYYEYSVSIYCSSIIIFLIYLVTVCTSATALSVPN